MRRILAGVLASTAAMIIIGCESGTSPGTVSAAPADAGPGPIAPEPSTDQPILYGNGHTLSLPTSDIGVGTFESELLRMVNAHRVSKGLNALIYSGRISDAARAHSQHMIDHRFFSHWAPEGFTPGERLAMAGVDWTLTGENIASGADTPQAVFEIWMNSPLHRARIESAEFTHAGVGYAQDSWPTSEYPAVHYWAMLFLRR